MQREAEEIIAEDDKKNKTNGVKEHVENLAKKYIKKCINEYCEEHTEEFIKQVDNTKITIMKIVMQKLNAASTILFLQDIR